ncbi:MAG: hypothetical protein ACFFAV_10280, partial [Candidatus Hermodarchaeota archaeon]
MVKYYHCEKCKKVYNTENWIGEVHTYNGSCSSCIEKESQEQQTQQEQKPLNDIYRTGSPLPMKNAIETTQSSPLEIEKNLLLNLAQRAEDILSSGSSIDVLIKEIRDG